MKARENKNINTLLTAFMINNDRKMHLNKFYTLLNESEIQFYIENQIRQCEIFHNLYLKCIDDYALGGFNENETTLSGKLFHLWIELKSTMTTMVGKKVIENCIISEVAALKAIKKIMENLHPEENSHYFLIENQEKKSLNR